MDPTVAICVAATFVATALVVVTVVAGVAAKHYWEFKLNDLELQQKAMEIKAMDKKGSLDYSKDLIEFIRTIIGQQAVLKFRDFQDKYRQVDKITAANCKKLVEDIAVSSNAAINRNNIQFDAAIFNESFYNEYIVQTSMMYAKDLVAKLVGDNIDELM